MKLKQKLNINKTHIIEYAYESKLLKLIFFGLQQPANKEDSW